MSSGRSVMRKAFAIVLAICAAFGVLGVLLAVVGEWDARRQLPPDMRSPEAIQRYYDGAVCLGCSIGGGMVVIGSVFMTGIIVLIWLIVDLGQKISANSRGFR